ncbi:MAG: S8 family serine peptidase [Bdellovibrio sp.]
MGIHGRSLFVFLSLISFSALAAQPEAVPGEFVVKLRGDVSVQKFSAQSLSQKLGALVKSSIPGQNIVVVKRPVIENSAYSVNTLSLNPLVEIAEPNYIYRINRTPNDPLLGNLWGLRNVGQADSENHSGLKGLDVDAEKAWDISTGSSSVVIAVIDTGVDYNHPDLKDNVWVNEVELNGLAGVDDDNNGYVDDVHGMNFTEASKPVANGLDDHGHGSHCSGVIGARGDDGRGIVGLNWNVRIMPIKFLGADGGGSLEGAILAIDYATKMGAKILSNSWGGGGFSQTLKEAIERSNAAGTLFVAAAGNDGSNNDSSPTYPANYEVPNILTVAAIDNRGNLASFSNYGKKTVHVGAPGVNVYSAVVGGGYDSWSGTSMATPHVSGIAGLLAASEPSLTGVEMKERIMSTARRIPALVGKTKTGGLSSAYNALANVVTPPDMNDPAQWASKAVSVSSAHPYGKKTKEIFELDVPGAKEVALYFSRFETEKNYDKVTLYDRAGNKVAEMSGNYNDSYSPAISGDYVRIVFTSDDSVEGYGFDVTKAAFR